MLDKEYSRLGTFLRKERLNFLFISCLCASLPFTWSTLSVKRSMAHSFISFRSQMSPSQQGLPWPPKVKPSGTSNLSYPISLVLFSIPCIAFYKLYNWLYFFFLLLVESLLPLIKWKPSRTEIILLCSLPYPKHLEKYLTRGRGAINICCVNLFKITEMKLHHPHLLFVKTKCVIIWEKAAITVPDT